MQFNNKDYNPDQHDRWRALTVKNPYATQLVTAAFEDGGFVYAEKSIEVRSKYTNYRGDLLICSSKNPDLPGFLLVDHGLVAVGKDAINAEHTAELIEETAQVAILKVTVSKLGL